MALADSFGREIAQQNAREFCIARLFYQQTGAQRKARMTTKQAIERRSAGGGYWMRRKRRRADSR
jgi:hypothetical protein